MLKILKITVCCVLFLAMQPAVFAQQLSANNFVEQIDAMIKPAADLKITAETYPDFEAVNREISQNFLQIVGILGSIYSPLMKTFQNRLANPALQKGLSEREKNLLNEFKVSSQGLSEENLLVNFRLLMKKRPSIASKQSSWTQIKAPLTVSGKLMYDQLLAIDNMFSDEKYKESYAGYGELGFGNQQVNEINDQLQAALQRLPKRKVKYRSESIIIEMEDPESAINLYKQYEVKRQEAFRKQYALVYDNWQKEYQRIRLAGKKLDEILHQTSNGSQLTGNDTQLLSVIADVQAKVWEALYQLANQTRNVIVDGQNAEWSRKQTEQTLSTYLDFELVDKH